MIDVSKIKVGDDGTIKVRFVRIGSNGFGADINYGRIFVKPEEIATHTPKPREFKLGDRVIRRGSQSGLVISAIDGDEAWIKTLGGCHFTALISELRHADESE